jgi:GH24 family phage-related lysozyme (muramidase)
VESGSKSIPDDAITFVLDEEDGSPAYYVKTEEHWSWPGGVSGPTVGGGYDFGYVTVAEAQADWAGILDDATIERMIVAVGRRGAAAEAFVQAHRDEITITWDQAVAEFKTREVPKWLTRCRAALPNFDLLPGDCQGALFSLSYNRGTGGYADPGPRDLEMREIKAAMIAKNYAAIPAYLRSMKRLWPTVKDLQNRRDHEAALFEKGLAST